MSSVRGVAVVVPAHDEADHVLRCLDAVAVARRRLSHARPAITSSVTVVLDACRDDTARLVATRADVVVVEVDAHCVGTARSAGTAVGIGGFPISSTDIWTAHTDADSCVPPEWLVVMVAAAEDGVDALLGVVTPDDALVPPVRAAWTALNPARHGHPYVHGANLGVRASTLLAVGGWAPLATGEDVDLAARLRATTGVTVRSTAAHPVITSSRAVARAPDGFSTYLNDLTVA